MKYYLAIDIGASSGRHILGHMENGRMVLEEVWRFDNKQIHKNGHDCWDIGSLWKGITDGLKACKELGKIPSTIGIDTWAVDFVLVDSQGNMIGDAVAYRDSRTEKMDRILERYIPHTMLYSRTGIQKQIFNTVYQLVALKREHPEQLQQADRLLMIPDYFNYRLTGVMQNEYTNATSTGMIYTVTKGWDKGIIGALTLPWKLFKDPVMPGTVLGGLTPEVQAEVGFDSTVILPATHDTGSAFLAVPARDDNAVYLSSGTWSLLGVENDHAITSEQSRLKNFTNEGGAWGRYRYLKNIMGLWMLQSVRRELNGETYVEGREQRTASEQRWTFSMLSAAARGAEGFPSVVDVNKDCFLSPDSMTEAIKAECAASGQQIPVTVGELAQCIYHSLALCYKNAILELQELTGKTYTSINIVGGGCQDDYLNECTAKATGLPVYAGPVEGTAIGNLLVQMIEGGDLPDLQTARDTIRSSFDIKEIDPS
ncbi:MAG: rhamnulokinase [Clostridia bacterium]|nr:rhamnulokinase [Clostridia bacterium]